LNATDLPLQQDQALVARLQRAAFAILLPDAPPRLRNPG